MRSLSLMRSSAASRISTPSLSIGAERRQHRQLIDQLRDDFAREHASRERRMLYAHVTNQLPGFAVHGNDFDRGAPAAQHVQHSGASGIQADVVNDEIGFGKHQCSSQKKCRRRKITRNCDFARLKWRATGNRDRPSLPP